MTTMTDDGGGWRQHFEAELGKIQSRVHDLEMKLAVEITEGRLWKKLMYAVTVRVICGSVSYSAQYCTNLLLLKQGPPIMYTYHC